MFDPAVFAARRDAYMQAIGPGAVAVVRSLPERLRNGDAYYPFRQQSDVFYLTGFPEPETTLVLRPGAETERFVMFVRPRDPEMETWDGRRAGLEGAKAHYGADEAYPAAELAEPPRRPVANCDELHYGLGLDDEMDRLIARRSRSCARPRSAASDRRARSSIRAPRCTSCGCTSGPEELARCARPPRSPRTRTSPRCAPADPACSSTSSRR